MLPTAAMSTEPELRTVRALPNSPFVLLSRRRAARFAAPLDEFDARRRDGPLADRPDRCGGGATLAGARIDPVPSFGRARLSQAQADPGQRGGSGSILSYELRPACAVPRIGASRNRKSRAPTANPVPGKDIPAPLMISSASVFATWRSASRSVCTYCFMVNATSA